MKYVYKCLVGSRAYGTNFENSDFDYKGIYVQDIRDIVTFDYKEQIDESKDITYYEIKRFLELAMKSNPTMLEMLFTEDFLIKDKCLDILFENKHIFLTKKCKQTFVGYAISQIKKAKGLNKKMNFEKSKMERKSVLDFCYFVPNGSVNTYKVLDYFQKNNIHGNIGLSKINNIPNSYFVFNSLTIPYRGICSDDSNDVCVSSIPIGEQYIGILTFNKDGYSSHCKDYSEYQTWIEERNINRYISVRDSEEKIDSKNLMHCRRLIDIGIEIAKTGTFNVKIPNADYLKKIRTGEYSLVSIIEQIEADIVDMDSLYEKSNLPDDVDLNTVKSILLDIRNIK